MAEISLTGNFAQNVDINGNLSVAGNSALSGHVSIGGGIANSSGSLAVGDSTVAVMAPRSIAVGKNSSIGSSSINSAAIGSSVEVSNSVQNSVAMGNSAKAKDSNSFVWSGVPNDTKFATKGEGTFCINPQQGVEGVYIGENGLDALIRDLSSAKIMGGENSFTEKNSFSGGVSVSGGLSVDTGNLTIGENSTSTFKHKVYLEYPIPNNDASTLAATTSFVDNQFGKMIPSSGESILSGRIHVDEKYMTPSHDDELVTKSYVDSTSTNALSGVTITPKVHSRGKNIADITVNNEKTSIYMPQIVGGANTTVSESDGVLTINCSPNAEPIGGTIKVPVGTIIPICISSSPEGFLPCDGRALNTADYSELFSAIRYTFGGSDSTFNIPRLNNGEFLEGSNSFGVSKTPGLPIMKLDTSKFECSDEGGHSHGISVGLGSCSCSENASIKNSHRYGSSCHSTTYAGQHHHIITGTVTPKSDSIYGKSETVQPKSMTVLYYIKAKITDSEKTVLKVDNQTPDSNGGIMLTDVVRSVNGQKATYGNNGSIYIDTGINSINGMLPNDEGELKLNLVTKINDVAVGSSGIMVIDTGVMKINGQRPDSNGNIVISTSSSSTERKTLLWGNSVMHNTYTEFSRNADATIGWISSVEFADSPRKVENSYNWSTGREGDTSYLMLNGLWTNYRQLLVFSAIGADGNITFSNRLDVSDMQTIAKAKMELGDPVLRQFNLLGGNASRYWYIDIGKAYTFRNRFYVLGENTRISSIWGIN